MKRGVYLIRDQALEAFLIPMFFQSEGAAVRAFTDEVNRDAADNIMHQHPEHFSLFHSGEYDDETGLFVCHEPRFVLAAHSVLDPR